MYEEENKDTEVIERAIDIFLHTAEVHCTNRDVTKANKALSKALNRAKKLGEQHPKVRIQSPSMMHYILRKTTHVS